MVEIEFSEDLFLPCYRHLLDSDADINFLWGGRDSGKSHFIAQKLITKCLGADYFRCILIKKTAESIKDSQWQTIKDVAEDWGVDHLFTFNISPLEIRCINGNKFIARGCDNPGKLKSIKDPSDAWYEEGDQLSLDDFVIAASTLRSDKAKVQQWFSFNPETKGEEDEFWIKKNYLSNATYNGYFEYTSTFTIGAEEVEYKISSTHTTYHDNPYCKAQRKIFLESLAQIDSYWYNVFTLGKWGKKQVKRPYCHNFNEKKHVSNRAVFNPKLDVYAMIDFNCEPFPCSFAHIWRDKEGEHFHIFKTIALEVGDVYKMCDKIKDSFDVRHLSSMIFTGDATQRKKEITQRNNIHGWQIIAQELKINDTRLQVPRSNPSVKENRHLVNAVLSLHPDFIIHPSCTLLINECKYTETDEEGNIIKKNRNNSAERADALDGMRYGINTWLPDFIERVRR